MNSVETFQVLPGPDTERRQNCGWGRPATYNPIETKPQIAKQCNLDSNSFINPAPYSVVHAVKILAEPLFLTGAQVENYGRQNLHTPVLYMHEGV